MSVPDAKRLMYLETENTRLKTLLAETLRRKWWLYQPGASWCGLLRGEG